MRVIYIQEQPRFSRERQEAIVRPQPGDKVYIEGRNGESLDAAMRACRNGHAVICAHGVRVLGNSPTEITEALVEVEKRGKAIEDAETGKRTDRECGTMVRNAIRSIRGEASIKGRAEGMGRAGGLARAKLHTKARMPVGQARKIWRDLSILTNELALDQMTGWTIATAYKHLKAPGRKRGRK